MVTQGDPNAPYAPLVNVLSAIRRYRDRGLPETITQRELTQIGIPEGNTPRTLQALRLLGLIEDDGAPAEAFQRIRRASTEEYSGQLAAVLKAAYAPVFGAVDPATATDIELSDAFRFYEPVAQRPRMLVLFRGLAAEARIIEGEPEIRQRRRRTGAPARRSSSKASLEQQPDGLDTRAANALIAQLPKSGRWTATERKRWVQALQATVDFIVMVSDDEAEIGDEDDDEHGGGGGK